MKKNKQLNKQTSRTKYNNIPDIRIIDLEHGGNIDEEDFEFAEPDPYSVEEDDLKEFNGDPKRGLRSFLNLHMLLLLVFLVFVVCIVVRFKTWGVHIDLSEIIHGDPSVYADVLDQVLPRIDSEGNPLPTTGNVDTIVVFGNAPFSDNRDSDDNLANLIADATKATVYNCSVSSSYLAAQWPFFDANKAPMDAYGFYWLVTLGVNGANANYYPQAAAALGDATPPEAQEVYDTLTSLDFGTVDVIVIMYDAADYLLGHEIYDYTNPTNIKQFTGNLEAGIELLQTTYPEIRIIVMSPTYAYAVDDNGNYVSSDMYQYGQDVLSTYVIKEYDSCAARSVSFIDHLYGTITEDNAQDYLIDNVHLNLDGRKKVLKRFLDVLHHYDNTDN